MSSSTTSRKTIHRYSNVSNISLLIIFNIFCRNINDVINFVVIGSLYISPLTIGRVITVDSSCENWLAMRNFDPLILFIRLVLRINSSQSRRPGSRINLRANAGLGSQANVHVQLWMHARVHRFSLRSWYWMVVDSRINAVVEEHIHPLSTLRANIRISPIRRSACRSLDIPSSVSKAVRVD